MSETKRGAEEALEVAWNRLVLAVGGLALAAGSIVTYAEGKITTGVVETVLSGGLLLAAHKMKREE